MSLPVVTQPTHVTELRDIGKIKYRNFVGSEQKSLLAAIELGDQRSVFNTMLSIVDACTDKKVDASKLCEADLEFLFMKIYTRSVQNKVEGQYTCHNVVDLSTVKENKKENSSIFAQPVDTESDEFIAQQEADALIHDEDTMPTMVECGHQFKIVIPVDDATIDYGDDFSERKVIKASDDVEIHLRVPSATEKSDFIDADETDEFIDVRVAFVYFSHVVALAENITTHRDSVKFEDFYTWFGTLSPTTIEGIIDFIHNEPKLGYDFNVTCPKCGNKDVIRFRGVESFFV